MKANSQKLRQAGFSDFLLNKNAGFLKNRAVKTRADFGYFGGRLLRLTALILLSTMSAMLLRGVGGTVAYLSDLESSTNNEFTAGTLDFQLSSRVSTSSICVTPRTPLQKTISITNLGNPLRYQTLTNNFSGAVCDYVWLEANINGGTPEYTGPVKDFDYGLTAFSNPDDWNFVLSTSTTTPLELQGQTCEFTFDFQGAQTRNNLTFPTGFSDFENSQTEVQAPYCQDYEIRSMGYWKNHHEIYEEHLPQFLGATTTDEFGNATGTDEMIGTEYQVNQIFNADNSVMRNKLKKQLLAMKFNIVHFLVDDYVPAGGTDDLDTIVEQADALLRQIPAPPDAELEAMKNLLESVNIQELVRICDSCEPPPPPDSCAMRITKTTDKDTVAPGEEITYHLTLDNYGTKVCTGGGVRIKDTYTSALEYLSYTSNRRPGGFNRSTGYLEWNFGNVYPNDPLIEIDLKMKVKTQAQCDSTITNTAKFWSNQTNWGAPVTAESTVVCPLAPDAGKIILNEFLPNPIGRDKALKPGGEWVELYNMGSSSVDVAGWTLYDESDSHKLLITTTNTDTGSTVIAPGGYLVVYRNGSSNFSLDNTGGDQVRLFNGKITEGGILIDSHTYTEDAPEGKSFARASYIPDVWVDPIPTPGEENTFDGAEAVFGPAIAEEGEDGYVAPEPVIAPTETGGNPPNPLYQGGGDNDPALIPDTTPAETPVSDAE
ncbi:MAG: lamin tail domain-containing protein, partial [Candidatus Gracilibacteria bacterium]